MQPYVFLLSAANSHHRTFAVLSRPRLRIAVLESLRTIESEHAIGARSKWLRSKRAVRRHPDLHKLPVAVRPRNAAHIGGRGGYWLDHRWPGARHTLKQRNRAC